MKHLLFCTLAASMVATSVNALSCLPPNLARTFNWLADEEDLYVIYVGKLKAVKPYKDPNKNQSGSLEGIPYAIEGSFEGHALLTKSLGEVVTLPTTINITCAAHWCGGFGPNKEDRIFFFKRDQGKHSISFGPCDGFAPDAQLLKAIPILQRCLKRGKCTNQDIESLDQQF